MNYVAQGQLKELKAMCHSGFDPNFQDSNGRTPLTLACSTPDRRNIIMALVEHGAHIDFRNKDGQVNAKKLRSYVVLK
ncbi:unnamed protein product [Gongylonema pulchrum]|uniref:ANK_REP_REGION domain-containing protein n=1 Tax=Gongylonema pulchrum TaxID=637853 RepID=A0A183DGL3_9BILA|nr:unnamed protein product [Gongylonema pulchrum]